MEEQINKNKIEKNEITSQETSGKTERKQLAKTPNNNLVIWIILSIGLLIILTITLWIGLKIKNSKNSTTTNNTPIQNEAIFQIDEKKPPISEPMAKEEKIRQAFYYPNAIKEQTNDDFDLVFYTNDSATIVFEYYEELIEINNWYLGPSGLATGNETGFFHIYQDDFHADINISAVDSKHGLTKIEIRINPQNKDSITSTFNRPAMQQTPPPDTKKSQVSDQGEYILPFSSSRAIAREDLKGLNHWQLKVARNEIYARHGRNFVHQDLACYFKKQSWYAIDPNFTEDQLSRLETSNAVFILNYEKEVSSPLINKDSGCK